LDDVAFRAGLPVGKTPDWQDTITLFVLDLVLADGRRAEALYTKLAFQTWLPDELRIRDSPVARKRVAVPGIESLHHP